MSQTIWRLYLDIPCMVALGSRGHDSNRCTIGGRDNSVKEARFEFVPSGSFTMRSVINLRRAPP